MLKYEDMICDKIKYKDEYIYKFKFDSCTLNCMLFHTEYGTETIFDITGLIKNVDVDLIEMILSRSSILKNIDSIDNENFTIKYVDKNCILDIISWFFNDKYAFYRKFIFYINLFISLDKINESNTYLKTINKNIIEKLKC